MNAEPRAQPLRASRPLTGDKVTPAHGGGGKAMRDLIKEVFTSVFESTKEDQARLAKRVLRSEGDATRGGLASALNEIAEASNTGIDIEEASLLLRTEVKGVCEILGLDPLYLANEETLALFVPAREARAALGAMRARRGAMPSPSEKR